MNRVKNFIGAMSEKGVRTERELSRLFLLHIVISVYMCLCMRQKQQEPQ